MARLAWLLILGLGLAVAGCTRSNDSYCCTDPALCADVGGVVDDGCRAGTLCDDTGALEGVPHTCVNDPAAVTCGGPEDCAAPTPACVDRVCVPCASDADCPDATAARCNLDTSRCVSCDDGGQCTRFDSDTCSDGVCVECAAIAEPAESGECAPGEPICVAPGICRGCTDHRECASGACDLASGACVLPADIAYVDETGSDDATACSFTEPCANITDGVATARPYVVISAGAYQEDLAIAADVTLVGHGATLTALTNGVVAVTVSGASTSLAIFGMTIDGSAGGFDCNGGVGTATTRVGLVDVTVSNHTGVGVVVYRCDLIVARSRLTANNGGGAEVTQGGFDITNSVITGNGQLGTFGGLSLSTPRPDPARLAFNTISGNSLASGNAAPGVSCSSAVGLPAFHSNLIHGNLDGTDAAQVSGSPNCTYEYSLIDPPVEGTENRAGDPGYADAALHLLADSPAVDGGKPDTGIIDDIDGQVRPADQPDIGADEYVP